MNASKGEIAEATRLIAARIAELGDWRGETLARMRALIRAAAALNEAGRARRKKSGNG
jgi:hypothetical protein